MSMVARLASGSRYVFSLEVAVVIQGRSLAERTVSQCDESVWGEVTVFMIKEKVTRLLAMSR